MLLSSLLITPLVGVLAILMNKDRGISTDNIKLIALTTSIYILRFINYINYSHFTSIQLKVNNKRCRIFCYYNTIVRESIVGGFPSVRYFTFLYFF